MEKLTIKKVKEESIDYLISALGAAVGITVMKLATGYGLNKWAVPMIGFGGGIAIRLATKNDMAKSFGNGLGIAGGLDLSKKALDFAVEKIPALASLTKNLPGFSGFEQLRGPAEMDYTPYTEVSNTTSAVALAR